MDGEVEVVAEEGQIVDAGLGVVAEAEGFSFVHFDGVETIAQDGFSKLRGAPETKLVEREDDDEVNAGLSEECELLCERRDERKMAVRKKDVCGMRVEGDGDGAGASLACAGDNFGDDGLVAAVDPVEVADGDDRWGRIYIIQSVSDDHGLWLPGILAINDATSLAWTVNGWERPG